MLNDYHPDVPLFLAPRQREMYIERCGVVIYALLAATRQFWPENILGVLQLLNRDISFEIVDQTLRQMKYRKTKKGSFYNSKLKPIPINEKEGFRVKASNQYILACDLEKTDFGELITYQRDGQISEED